MLPRRPHSSRPELRAVLLLRYHSLPHQGAHLIPNLRLHLLLHEPLARPHHPVLHLIRPRAEELSAAHLRAELPLHLRLKPAAPEQVIFRRAELAAPLRIELAAWPRGRLRGKQLPAIRLRLTTLHLAALPLNAALRLIVALPLNAAPAARSIRPLSHSALRPLCLRALNLLATSRTRLKRPLWSCLCLSPRSIGHAGIGTRARPILIGSRRVWSGGRRIVSSLPLRSVWSLRILIS